MNVYGPRQDYHGAYIAVIMKMLDAIDRGEGPTILGDGTEAFDFVAVEDCAAANVCAMKADSVDRFYNVGTGKRTSLKELAEMLLELTGCDAADQVRAAQPGDAGAQPHRRPRSERAEEIGFTARSICEEGLRRLIDWRAHAQVPKSKRAAAPWACRPECRRRDADRSPFRCRPPATTSGRRCANR